MKAFSAEEIATFLRGVDAQLGAGTAIEVIGGAAIALLLSARRATKTKDIDLGRRAEKHFMEACERARAATGLDIPISPAGVHTAPYDYEDRLRPLAIAGLRHLTIYIPERHDLAVMKLARSDEHDLAAVEEMHRDAALDLNTLVDRYRETLTQLTEPEGMFRWKFLNLIERLFGEERASEVERRLRRP